VVTLVFLGIPHFNQIARSISGGSSRNENQRNAWIYWYALADAQIKANFFDKAQSSIQKGLSFNLANQEF
jgi:hypothetical protein